jgi:hypothetical protein
MRTLARIAITSTLLALTYASAQASGGFTLLANVPGTSYADPTCPNQSTCYYQVTAVNAQGQESVPSACRIAQLCLNGNQAIAIMPRTGTHTVNLTWLAGGSAGVTHNIYRRFGPLPGSVHWWQRW